VQPDLPQPQPPLQHEHASSTELPKAGESNTWSVKNFTMEIRRVLVAPDIFVFFPDTCEDQHELFQLLEYRHRVRSVNTTCVCCGNMRLPYVMAVTLRCDLLIPKWRDLCDPLGRLVGKVRCEWGVGSSYRD
jgi:hypothetical protein